MVRQAPVRSAGFQDRRFHHPDHSVVQEDIVDPGCRFSFRIKAAEGTRRTRDRSASSSTSRFDCFSQVIGSASGEAFRSPMSMHGISPQDEAIHVSSKRRLIPIGLWPHGDRNVYCIPSDPAGLPVFPSPCRHDTRQGRIHQWMADRVSMTTIVLSSRSNATDRSDRRSQYSPFCPRHPAMAARAYPDSTESSQRT